MRQITILFVIITLVIAGCAQKQEQAIVPSKSPYVPDTNVKQIKDTKIDDRRFIYGMEPTPNGPVKRTMVSPADPQFAYNIYGTTNLQVSNCIAMDEGSYKVHCLSTAAIYLNDSTICENNKAEFDKTGCYYLYAIKSADPLGCDLIDKLDKKQLQPGYADGCKRQVAILTGNSSLCVSDGSQSDNNLSICKEIADSKMLVGKDECRQELVTGLLTEIQHFSDTINWLRKEHKDEKVLSWWDYGGAMDCVGLKSVISNKDLDDSKILEVAYLSVQGNESELVSFMKSNNVKYLMIPNELLIINNDKIDGKYAALNYLACARNNEIIKNNAPGISKCEKDSQSNFKSSILYKAIVLDSLDGFKKVYEDPSGYVKVFKLV